MSRALPFLFAIAVLVLVLIFVCPLVFRPGVEPPPDLRFLSPYSMAFALSNQNVTPVRNLEYTCEVSRLVLAGGAVLGNAKVVTRGAMRNLPGRRAIPVRCQTAYLVRGHLQALEYQLTLKYRAYPWPQDRTSLYRIAAQIDAQGQVTAWKVQ